MQTWYFVLENKTKIDIIWCHKTIQIWTCIYLSVCFSTQAALNIILHCTISLYFFHFLLLPSLVSAVLFFPKAATLHLNLMVAQIKIRGVRVSDSMAALCHVQREREEGGAGGMDSCSKADCTGWLSYQGSSHASKSQIKHPHLSFQPAALLQVPAPSLPPCVTELSVDYQTLKQSRGSESDRLRAEWWGRNMRH